MKKFLIYSDCHFSQYSSIVRSRGEKYSTRLHNLIDSISWAEHLADEKNCDEVFCLGDYFDSSDLKAEEITALQDVYFSNKPHTFLTGNHDANISNLEFSSMQIFKGRSANIITSPSFKSINEYVDFYFIPYLTNEKLKPISNFLNDNGKKRVVFSHNDLAGLHYGKFISQSGFDVKDIIDNCTIFLNGHLHNGGIIEDKIILVGNLTGQNFNEDATKYSHCAYILTVHDDGSIILDPYENPHALNFYKLYIGKEQDLHILKTLKSNSVVSISCNKKYLPTINDFLLHSNNIIESRVITMYGKNLSSNNDDLVDLKVEDHLQQFIEYAQTKLGQSDILNDELVRLSSM